MIRKSGNRFSEKIMRRSMRTYARTQSYATFNVGMALICRVPLLQGWSARATSGVTATFPGGASLGAGGEFGGVGSVNHIWTWTARGHIPF
jgi:hypothetical protein